MSKMNHYFVVTTLYTVDGDKSTDEARTLLDGARTGSFDDAIKVSQEHMLHVLPVGLTFRLEQPSAISAEPYWVQVNSGDGQEQNG